MTARAIRVALAQTGSHAVALARSARPALFLMDVQPELDGLGAARPIRATAELRETPILMLTAPAMEGDRERCLAAGADAPAGDDGCAAPVTRARPRVREPRRAG